MKIPKIIYSTWISDKPLPEKFHKYIESWKKHLPGYEIRMITLENTPRNPFIDTFIRNKKFAVAAQYARTQRIFETGGLYFDVDIEAVKNFDELLRNEMFAGIECKGNNHFVNNALFGAQKGHPFMMDCMTYMNSIDVTRCDIEISTGPLMFTELLKRRGWVPANENSFLNGIRIFKSDYFYPYGPDEQFNPDCITKETYAVHHWAATWKNSVSIIILCGQRKELLEETIELAKKQSVKAIEVILINDNFYNSDNSDQLTNVARKYKVKILKKQNMCLSSARNTAIEFAKGRWILVLKSGDNIDLTFIENTIDKGDIVGMKLNPAQTSGSPCNNSFIKNEKFLFRKEVWEKISGYNETMIDGYADEDFFKRAEAKGFSINIVNNTNQTELIKK